MCVSERRSLCVAAFSVLAFPIAHDQLVSPESFDTYGTYIRAVKVAKQVYSCAKRNDSKVLLPDQGFVLYCLLWRTSARNTRFILRQASEYFIILNSVCYVLLLYPRRLIPDPRLLTFWTHFGDLQTFSCLLQEAQMLDAIRNLRILAKWKCPQILVFVGWGNSSWPKWVAAMIAFSV